MPSLARRASVAVAVGSRATRGGRRSRIVIVAVGRPRRGRSASPSRRHGPPRWLPPSLTLVAGFVHHLDSLIDGQQAARESGVQHLGERILAFARHHVARLTDEIFLAL